MIVCVDPARAEADLLAGRVACPGCGGPLRAWGHARPRSVRQLDGSSPRVRPRRAACRACTRTHVLLPGTCLPRRADAIEVVGAALVAKAGGAGFRRIAADLDRPPSTVRRWLRAARDRAHLERLRQQAVRQVVAFAPELVACIQSARGPLADVLTALAAAVQAVHRRLPTFTTPIWALINVITRGRLLAGPSTA